MSLRFLLEPIRFVIALSSVAGLTAPTLAIAQQVRPVPEGATVRVWARDVGLQKTKARVLGWTDSTASFWRLQPPGDSVLVPFRGVTRLDHLRGKNTSGGILRGLAIGGGAGAVAGLLIGESAVSGCQEFLCELESLNYMGYGLLIGGAVGAALGAASAPDRWVRVELPVSAGFPPYEQPFHETTAFRVLLLGAGLLLTVATSGG